MSLPANVTTITVSHKHTAVSGTAMTGTVTWTLPIDLVDASALTTVNSSSIRTNIDLTGSWSVTVPVVDDPDLQPTGWTYTVTFALTDSFGATRTLTKQVQVTAAMAPAIDWASLAELSTVTEVSPYARPTVENTFTKDQTLSGALRLGDPATLPATDPTGGGTLYADAGSLKWRSATGTETLTAVGEFDVMNYYNAAGGANAGINAVMAAVAQATATGGGIIRFPPSTTPLTLAAPIQLNGGSGHSNLTFRGAGREATRINCAQGFIVAVNNADACRVEDMRIECSTVTNTFNGIDVDYPRHWYVTGCLMTGFGGDTIRYRGGLNSGTARNYIIARDPGTTNGHAGISFTATAGGVAGTTCRVDHDYVGAGRQYGFYFSNQVTSTVLGPIVEGVQTGIRFDVCSRGTLIDPYTEATSVSSIEMADTNITMVGGTLTVGQPVIRTWSGVAFDERTMSRIGRNSIDTGKGLIFGGVAGEIDPSLAPSIRAGSGSPEGVVAGVVGSLWLRTNGGAGTTLYRKESGTGSTGWVST